jgi:ribosomal protein S18 acetylase RimI-like enzyme
MEPRLIQTIEELAMNAWPALQTVLLDGWVIRFANGYTRRANSVIALYPGQMPAGEKLAECERLYHAQGLPVIFKLNGVEESRELDGLLAERGFQAEASTSVQTMDLRGADFQIDERVVLDSTPGEAWQTAFARLSGLAAARQATHHQMLQAILPTKCFAALAVNGVVQACGLAVLQACYVGFFDIVVDAGCRRQGLGESIMGSLLAWAQQNGARSAYLQVMKNNPPALSLYAKLGFREAYPYWYRVK